MVAYGTRHNRMSSNNHHHSFERGGAPIGLLNTSDLPASIDCPLARVLATLEPVERAAIEAAIEARVVSRAAAASADAARHLDLAQKGGRIGTFDIDMTDGAAVGSGAWAELLGEPPGVTVMSRRDWLARIHPADRDRIVVAIEQVTIEGFDLSIDYRIVLNDGTIRWIFSRNMIERDSQGRPMRAYGTCQDITERKTAEESAWRAAHLDALTGLPNRRLFQARLEAAAERSVRDSLPVGLALVDLDHLKRANDHFGHDAGDALLRAAGQRLSDVVGDTGTVARLGGDEFAALLPGANASALRTTMERAVSALHLPLVFEGVKLRCSSSAGGALAPFDGCEAGRLYKHADLALGAAKIGGKGRYVAFHPTMLHTHKNRVGRHRDAKCAATN